MSDEGWYHCRAAKRARRSIDRAEITSCLRSRRGVDRKGRVRSGKRTGKSSLFNALLRGAAPSSHRLGTTAISNETAEVEVAPGVITPGVPTRRMKSRAKGSPREPGVDNADCAGRARWVASSAMTIQWLREDRGSPRRCGEHPIAGRVDQRRVGASDRASKTGDARALRVEIRTALEGATLRPTRLRRRLPTGGRGVLRARALPASASGRSG